jgi:hypothetical protein
VSTNPQKPTKNPKKAIAIVFFTLFEIQILKKWQINFMIISPVNSKMKQNKYNSNRMNFTGWAVLTVFFLKSCNFKTTQYYKYIIIFFLYKQGRTGQCNVCLRVFTIAFTKSQKQDFWSNFGGLLDFICIEYRKDLMIPFQACELV